MEVQFAKKGKLTTMIDVSLTFHYRQLNQYHLKQHILEQPLIRQL